MTAILVTGASGYVGSAVCAALLAEGMDVVGVDRRLPPPHHPLGTHAMWMCDVSDSESLRTAFGLVSLSAIVHMAGDIEVAASVRDPLPTYRNNLATMLAVLELARDVGIGSVVFSSSAAVYGAPASTPIPEEAPTEPINPYGASKRMCERLLEDAAAYGIRGCSLRYFNAAGASRDGRLGERHDPETHLVPIVLRAALGTGPAVPVFGRDFPTPDGTAVRDYVHVEDLARAHVRAVRALLAGESIGAVNLGGGVGHSVLEVIAACEAAIGRPVPRSDAPRRAGDPPILVASIERAHRLLGWRPQRSDLPTVVEDAARFERSRG